QRVTPAKLVAGDRLDVLVDRSGRERSCYIRILHVLPPEPNRPVRPVKPKANSRLLTPVTTQTVSGVVVRIGTDSISIRSRDGEETVHVRRDTRFIGDGTRLELDDLTVNQRVF